MKNVCLSSLLVVLFFLNLPSVLAGSMRIYYQNPATVFFAQQIGTYQNGQTAYIDCSLNQTIYLSPFDDSDFSPIQGVSDWNVSSNFSYYIYNEDHTQRNNVIVLTMDPNFNVGSVSARVYNTLVTIYITRRSTPSLTITPTLCSAGQTGDFSATLNYYGPNSANVVWQATGGITVNGGSSYRVNDNTISRVTVQHNSYGTLTVYGEVPGCSNMQTNPVTYHIGTPTSSDLNFTGSPDPGSSLCSGQTYSFTSHPTLPLSQYSYNWSIPQGSSSVGYYYGYGPNVSVAPTSGTNPGGFIVQVEVTNSACGTTGSTSRTFFKSNCGGSYRVANNPTSNTLTVLFDPIDEVEYLPVRMQLAREKTGVAKEIKIREEISKQDLKGGLHIDINVQDLPRDTYYIQGIYENGKVESVRVIIN
ncbi:hypothetical protein [Spirosoma sordidisoli]|uniref:Uncharacterized protein n=1 Tax=Spirosoma sordidisoli TaxID=2502893 RepID=A0A4V1RVF9_9BACT|nr:hypothetical protein [Spirosoma sordidisoli]RYC66628.1 hypothetical protein EQG79_28980 [Spirosoma sordidisoli]